MGNFNIFSAIKDFIGVSWKLFIWSTNMSEEEYWGAIYEQERDRELCLTLH